MDKDSHQLISYLLKYVDKPESLNMTNGEELTEILTLVNYLKSDNPLHVLSAKALNLNLVRNTLKDENQNKNNRIKYKSSINTDKLDDIVDLSLWKNTPISSNNPFSAYESKKSNLLKNYNKNENEMFNNHKNRKFKASAIDENNDDEIGNKYIQSNTYMSNSYNLKRKK